MECSAQEIGRTQENKSAASFILEAEKVVHGKREFLELLSACILARGHALLEDNPGLGKTTAAKALAALIGSEERPALFKRIQFTPDLLPYDITGVDVFDNETRAFRFVPGPVLSNIVLADEINRTTPKVQSALLEVMAEGQVTVGGVSHRPPEPFFVIATQNPIESEGTFPLPAAQLDRFMIKLSLGYPGRSAELAILDENPAENPLSALKPVISIDEFLAMQAAVQNIFCHPILKEAIADIARETRTHRAFLLGASPRAALHLLAISRAFAFVKGRSFVTGEDIAALAVPVFCHRLKLRDPNASSAGIVRELAVERVNMIECEL